MLVEGVRNMSRLVVRMEGMGVMGEVSLPYVMRIQIRCLGSGMQGYSVRKMEGVARVVGNTVGTERTWSSESL